MVVKPKFCLIQNSAFRLKVSESLLSDTRTTACKQGGEAPRQDLPWTGWWGRSTPVYFDHCNGKGGQRVWRTQKSLKWWKLRYFIFSDISHPGSSKSRFFWISHFFGLLWAPQVASFFKLSTGIMIGSAHWGAHRRIKISITSWFRAKFSKFITPFCSGVGHVKKRAGFQSTAPKLLMFFEGIRQTRDRTIDSFFTMAFPGHFRMGCPFEQKLRVVNRYQKSWIAAQAQTAANPLAGEHGRRRAGHSWVSFVLGLRRHRGRCYGVVPIRLPQKIRKYSVLFEWGPDTTQPLCL